MRTSTYLLQDSEQLTIELDKQQQNHSSFMTEKWTSEFWFMAVPSRKGYTAMSIKSSGPCGSCVPP